MQLTKITLASSLVLLAPAVTACDTADVEGERAQAEAASVDAAVRVESHARSAHLRQSGHVQLKSINARVEVGPAGQVRARRSGSKVVTREDGRTVAKHEGAKVRTDDGSTEAPRRARDQRGRTKVEVARQAREVRGGVELEL